jgi:superfamily II DNA or RNA helicase
MIHFVFSDKDTRYLFLKCDKTNDELVECIDKSTKRKYYVHVFDALIKHINLTDPACYLKTWTGPPITQDFIFKFKQISGDELLYCSIGLWQIIYKFLKDKNVPYDGLDQTRFKYKIQHTYEEFKEIVDNWEMDIQPREYQYKSAYKILQWKRSLSQLATRAGKTLIAYMVFRYGMEYMGMKRILMIVPSIDLVKQGYNDFKDYKEFFKTECVWGGGKLVESSNLTIGTFQSLIKFLEKKDSKGKPNKKYNPHFFDDYDCVFVDEVHRATAAQTKEIISQPFMQKVKISYGMTGTLPPEKSIEYYCLSSLIGAKIQTIKPRELMDAGYISDIHINQCILKYNSNIEEQKELFIKAAEYAISNYCEIQNPQTGKNERVKLAEPKFLFQYEKEMPYGVLEAKQTIYSSSNIKEVNGEDIEKTKDEKDKEYIDLLNKFVSDSIGTNGLVIERMMVHFMEKRVDYLCNNILNKCPYNTLVLAHHTEYIKYLVDEVTRRMPDKIVCCIQGSTGSKQRDKIKETLKENNNCILIASYGCVGTGITLSNLCFGVLFESFKSESLNMQSLGRGLGLSKLKDRYEVYDIVDKFADVLDTKRIWLQGRKRQKIYQENQYDYDVINVNL